jgi:hypothetical protein
MSRWYASHRVPLLRRDGYQEIRVRRKSTAAAVRSHWSHRASELLERPSNSLPLLPLLTTATVGQNGGTGPGLWAAQLGSPEDRSRLVYSSMSPRAFI